MEKFDRFRIAGFDLFHHLIKLRFNLRLFLCNFVCLDIMAHNELVALFIWLSLIVDVFNTPRNNCNLTPHIIQVILRFNWVPGLTEHPDQRIANDCISDMPNMQRTIRVGTGMFKNNPFGSCRKLTVIRMPGSTNRCSYIIPSKDEIDVWALC